MATTIKEIMAAIATSKTKPAALPWQDAPPVCKETTKLVVDATRGWHRTTHWLHHAKVRAAVFTVLVVAGRLKQRGGAALVQAVAHGTLSEASAEPPAPTPPLVVIPAEMWFYLMRFFKRSWWKV